MGKKIWFVRHSIRADAGNKVSPPETDCSITDEGVKLAVSKAELLKPKISKVGKLNRIYSSPYTRTLETSYALLSVFKATELHIVPELSEMITVSYKNHKEAQVPLALLTYINAYHVNYPEQTKHVVHRCKRVLDMLEKEDFENVILVTHGGIMNTLIKMIMPEYNYENNSKPDEYVPRYCDHATFEFVDNKWVLYDSSWLN
jgi:broad specificity phosphatase PhoE